MTIQAWWLLRKLKRAQTCPDGEIFIDTDKMIALTVCPAERIQDQKQVKLKGYRYSLNATIGYLESLNYISISADSLAKVTYSGWYALSATVAGTLKTILLNVLIPIAVSVIAAVITTILMTNT